MITRRIETIENRIREIESTIVMVKMLQSKQDETIQTNFEVAHGLLLPAKIEKPKTVKLWLGATIIMEYTFDDALKMLEDNKQKSVVHLQNANEEMKLLQEQQIKLMEEQKQKEQEEKPQEEPKENDQ